MSSLLSLGLLSYACANGDTVQSGASGNGGSSNTGGNSSSNTGGTSNTGNTNGNTGGTSNTGNTTGSTGGVKGTGGTSNTGNTTGSTGGTSNTGNTTGSTGGTTGSTGGTTGGGGSASTSCGSSFSVAPNGFVTMPAVGGDCWSGYAYAGGDAGSTIMPDTATQYKACGSPCVLKISGTVGPAVAPSYAGTAYLGFNIGQPAGATTTGLVAPKGSGITVTFTNTSASKIRVQLNADSTGTTFWCADVTTSPATIAYSAFTQQCYNTPPGPAYAKAPIQAIALSMPGAATASTLNVTLVSVTENP